MCHRASGGALNPFSSLCPEGDDEGLWGRGDASCARATHGVVGRMGWTAGTTRGGVRRLGLTHMGLTHMETQRGRLWTTGGRRCVGSKNRQTATATTSTTPRRQLLGAANAQTAPATSSTAPAHQRLGPANAETTPAGAPAAAADRTQRPDAARGARDGCDCPGPCKETATRRHVTQGGGGGGASRSKCGRICHVAGQEGPSFKPLPLRR